jgi:hypothetical protein
VQVNRYCDAETCEIKALTVATLVKRNLNEAVVTSVVESAFGGSMESGGKFCVDAFDRSLASVAVKKFLHWI